MAAILLDIAAVIEVAFGTYCFVTKANQRPVRNYIRIGAFAGFVLLTFASVIKWGFRWYGLALLLLVWAVLGAWALTRRKGDESEYRTRTIVRRAIRTLLLVVVVMVPAFVFPQYRAPRVTGKYGVATASYTYTDQNRVDTFSKTGENRELNVECWYPKGAAGTYPLVVFSHGILGIKASNTSTYMELASNGYVVCSIDFPHQSLFTKDANGHRAMIDNAFLQEYLSASNGKYDSATVFKLQQGWMDLRAADINFVLDTILAKTKDAGADEVYQRIDPEKIGLMGHSLGGESTALVARQRSDIDAVVNLDADLEGEYRDFVNGKEVMNTEVYPVPILTVLSDTLYKLLAAVPDADTTIAERHVTATAPDAFEVHLAGTDHMSMTDLPLVSPALVSLINMSVPKAGGHEANPLATTEKLNEIILQFFNTYLKGEGSFTSAGTY